MTAEQIAKKYVHGLHDALTDRQEIKDMMADIETYAERYHQAKLKELGIANVVGQREQLAAIFEKMNRQHITMLEIGDYNKLAKEILSS